MTRNTLSVAWRAVCYFPSGWQRPGPARQSQLSQNLHLNPGQPRARGCSISEAHWLPHLGFSALGYHPGPKGVQVSQPTWREILTAEPGCLGSHPSSASEELCAQVPHVKTRDHCSTHFIGLLRGLSELIKVEQGLCQS